MKDNTKVTLVILKVTTIFFLMEYIVILQRNTVRHTRFKGENCLEDLQTTRKNLLSAN